MLNAVAKFNRKAILTEKGKMRKKLYQFYLKAKAKDDDF